MKTVWEFDAERQKVWDAVADFESWPAWWRGVMATQIAETPSEKVASITWKGLFPHHIKFKARITGHREPHYIDVETWGDLRGGGIWTFDELEDGTRVTFQWEVETTSEWIQKVEWFSRPGFVLNHDLLMMWGGEGLARYLGARLTGGNTGRRDVLDSLRSELMKGPPLPRFIASRLPSFIRREHDK